MLRFKDLMERINIAKTKMGDVIKDFQDSDAPQFQGKSAEKRRQMAIAAKLEADRGVKEEVEELDENVTKVIKTADQMVKSGKAKEMHSAISSAIDKHYPMYSAVTKKKVHSQALARVKQTNEEVEDLDEVSTATLKSYRTKARAQGNAIVDKMKMGGGDWSKDQKDTKTLRKRAAGAQMSGKKLVKRGESLKTEELELDEGRMKELSMDMETMGDKDFKAKHKKSKGEMQKSLSKAEELKGNQHKIDANKNGKVDGHDFKILRNAKKARYQ